VIVDNLSKAFGCEEMVLAGEGSCRALHRSASLPPVYPITPGKLGMQRGSRHLRRVYLPIAFARALAVARRHRVGRVLAVFPSEEYLLLGWLLSRILRVPLLPWFHNTYLENRRGMQRSFAQWLQPRVFRDARHVFVMSEGMRRLYQQNYPHLSCSALLHPCPDAAPMPSVPPTASARPKVTLAGNIGAQCLDAATRMISAVRSLEGVQLEILSGTPREVLHRYGLLQPGDIVEALPREEMMLRLRAADALLLPHGFTGGYSAEEYATIFPTRTVDYLFAAVPILAHTPGHAFLTDFLLQHTCAEVVTQPSVELTAQKLHSVLYNPELRQQLVASACAVAPMFEAAAVRRHLEQYCQ
jgi:hypothetical protein